MLNQRIATFLDNNSLLADEQNGFRKKRACQDHVYVLDSLVRARLNEKLHTFTAFVDLKKAFDCINRDFMLKKVSDLGIDGKMYFAIKSLYSCTEACVKISPTIRTEWFETCFGVRQGDNLSPTLFNIYLNDLAVKVQESRLGIDVNGRNIGILLYADDIALISPTEENLQKMIDMIHEWSEAWWINVNLKKSQIMHFRPVGQDRCKQGFKYGTQNLDFTEKYKYLGVTFTEHLNYTENTNVLSQAAGRALGAVIAKYKTQGFMSYDTFSKLYESCVCPIMDYSSAVWGFGNFDKIDAVQYKAARSFLGVHKFAPKLAVEGDMGWLAPQYRAWLNILRMWNKLIQLDDNRLTQNVFINDYYLAQSGHENWCTYVYKILEVINEEDVFYDRQVVNIQTAKVKLLQVQETKWKELSQRKPKLRTYISFKPTLTSEKYCTLNLTPSERSLMAQLRCGILPLHIETGRFRKTKLEDRICEFCSSNKVEDECHFIFDCNMYSDEREAFLSKIIETYPQFIDFDEKDKLLILFQEFTRATSKFISKCFNTRKKALYCK